LRPSGPGGWTARACTRNRKTSIEMTAPALSRPHAPTPEDPLWYKAAVVYQVHVKSYRDSNADGFGDFRGLVEKLDYIQSLGVNCIWLLPFYPSPLRDD